MSSKKDKKGTSDSKEGKKEDTKRREQQPGSSSERQWLNSEPQKQYKKLNDELIKGLLTNRDADELKTILDKMESIHDATQQQVLLVGNYLGPVNGEISDLFYSFDNAKGKVLQKLKEKRATEAALLPPLTEEEKEKEMEAATIEKKKK